MMKSYVVCDLETTGLDPARDKIIEIGLVKVNNGEISATLETLVNPCIHLPVKIKKITGLDDAVFKNSPYLTEISGEVLNFIDGLPLVGHNISFDISFLEYHLRKNFNNFYDTLELARILYPDAQGYRLGDLCKYAEIDFDKQHRALSDAIATAELSLKLIDRLWQIELAKIIHINKFLSQAGSPWALQTHYILKKKTRNFSGEPLNLAYPFPAEIKSLTNGTMQKKYSVKYNSKTIKEFFSKDGPLSKNLQYFETRPQQGDMAVSIGRALDENKLLLMEAGTGTGKSLAYLVPSLIWTMANNKRTLVATHTINLQEQLWNKDIPILNETIGIDFKAALLKGRTNYLCFRRWEAVLQQTIITNGEALFFARLLMWLSITETGDKNELSLSMKEHEYWSQVSSETDTCLGSNCKWFKRYCFVSRARKKAEKSNIIITNHSMLFSDLKAENNIIPSFGALIIDEAHHLEDTATKHLSIQISRTTLKQWLKAVNIALGKLNNMVPPQDNNQWLKLIIDLKNDKKRLSELIDRFFDITGTIIKPRINNHYSRTSLRLKKGEPVQQLIRVEATNLITSIKSVIKTFKGLTDLMDIWGNIDELWIEHSWILVELITSGTLIANDLDFITLSNDQNHVYWLESNNELTIFNFMAAPINVGKLLHENLFNQNIGIVLTSATLTVNNSFQYFKERTGINILSSNKTITKIVQSPFAYEEQCLLCIDENMVLPRTVKDDIYYNTLAGALSEYILALEGRTLVLFTSHNTLKEIYFRIKDILEEKDIWLLGHNIDGGRTRLTEQFKNTPRSVLFGSSSFWEGVDLPGDILCNVIVIKLPFWPPNMPVIEARLEELTRNGQNAFTHFSLPMAVIRFKQGFGRLIRSNRDKGSVIIMDKRLITKKYGQIFLNSLPIKTHFRGNTGDIKKKITQWLNS